MDIIDIMLAKAMTPQGKTDTYVGKAAAAAAKAEKAKQDALDAIASVNAAAEDIATAQEAAADLLEAAQDALETAQSAQINMPEVYSTTGQNTDGYMTQKAVTDALEEKADLSTMLNDLAEKANAGAVSAALALKANKSETETALAAKADKTYVDQQIANIPAGGGSSSGGGISNLGSQNEGRMVVVGEDGNIKAGDITEEELIESLVRAGIYSAREAVGLDIDYQGKTYIRTQGALNLTMGADFDEYLMYGGRMRCNVADDGTINAFYGDNDYAEDGSNGQVMVYQPKFYYQRLPLRVEGDTIIRSESIILSARKQAGFKLHPIFDDGNGGELEYVLFSAYDGTLVDNKLSSVAGLQPATGMTISKAEEYATNRGTGWHIINMAAESANQMLQIVEYGTMNGQSALEAGISNLTDITPNINCSAVTGSTAALGNASGHATTTINKNNGVDVENTTAGKRAISYRGLENPWGNLWNFVGGINIKGDGESAGGAPYICTDFEYTPSTIGENYEYIGFNLPNTYGWISAMGRGNDKYDWVFMPAECASVANSLLPVGDNLWTVSHVAENKIVVIGGAYTFQDNNGLFYYGCDSNSNIIASNYGSRLMYIPAKGTTYNSNIEKWSTKIGG